MSPSPQKNEAIITIPKSELITLEMAKANPFCKTLISTNVKLQSPKHTYLSILLLELRGSPSCKYRPYIDLLPQDHSCFPINYSSRELEMLEGSPFLQMVLEKATDLKKDYEGVLAADAAFKKYSFP
jgi:hypothetical protein